MKNQRKRAFWRGYYAWQKYGKSIVDNPYKPGAQHDAWKDGYFQASQYKYKSLENNAPEGLPRHHDTYVVVKRTGVKRKYSEKQIKPIELDLNEPINGYLGYIKPGKNGRIRKFHVWTRNPPEDKWRNKIANKSYKEGDNE